VIEPLGNAQPQAASSANSTSQRIDTSTGDLSQPRSDLTRDQSAVEIGASIPIVFCKRVGDIGGVWLDPPAVEARIENNLGNEVSVWYRLVLSDGEIGPVASSDVFQGDQRRGSVEYAYDGRAGDWEPGDFRQQRWDTFLYNETREIQSGPEQQLDITVRSRGNNVVRFSVQHTNVSPGVGLTALPDYLATAAVSLQPISFEPSFLETGDLAGKAAGGLTQYFLQEVEEIDRPPMPLPAGFAYCGDGTGTFAGLSSISYAETFSRPESGDAFHKRQIHVFVREGLRVQRLLDDYEVDHSDLFPDLALYLLEARLGPSALIDYELLEESARFCDRQGLRFNGVLATPTNVRDFLNRIAPLQLLTVVQREGAIGLRPAVPVNGAGEIYVGPSQPRCRFDESNVVEGSFRMDYVPVAQRQPFVVEVLWRQQPEGNVGLIRATRVAYVDTPDDAPVEQYDLSEFCTDHVHAVKVATVILARRRHVTHTLSITTIPGSYAGALVPGDVVEVALGRESSFERRIGVQRQGQLTEPRDHRYLYQVNSVATDRQGNVGLALTHWPVDERGASLVALDVSNVDPGAVSLNPIGLPQPVDPGDPLFSEQFVNNYFTTLRFLPAQEIDGYLRICVEASNPIANGDLVLTLQPIGVQLTIAEGQTVGCVDVPIDGGLLDDLIDLDDLEFDDLIIPDLNDLLDTLSDLDGDTTIGDLDLQDLLDILGALTGLDGSLDLGLDLGDFAGLQGDLLMELIALLTRYDDGAAAALTIDQLLAGGANAFTAEDAATYLDLAEQLDLPTLIDLTEAEIGDLTAGELIQALLGLDLGDLAGLTVDELEDLLNGLDLDDLLIDLDELDLDGLTGLDGDLVGDLNLDGVFLDLDEISLDEITVGDIDAPDGYDVVVDDDAPDAGGGDDLVGDDLGVPDAPDVGALDVSNLRFNLDLDEFEEELIDENGCVGPTVGVYFESLSFAGRSLVVRMRLSPNIFPQSNLGPLSVTIGQTSPTVATIGIDGPIASPQPSNLPNLAGFTGSIVFPSNDPYNDSIIQGEFRIEFPEGAFPPAAAEGEPQLIYTMPISFLSHSGGFCKVNYLNTAVAHFGPAVALNLTTATITYAWNSGQDLDTTTSLTQPLNEGPVGWAHGSSTTYLSWSGDNTSISGSETVTVNLAALKTAYPSATVASLSLAGNWYVANGGVVTMTIVVNSTDGEPITTTYQRNVDLIAQGGTGQSMGSVSIDLFSGQITAA
jgi:hypothetical protein